IAERGEHHVIHGVRADAWAGCDVARVVVPGPTILRQIGVLDSPLNAAPGTVVELVPETEGSFDDVVDVAPATAGSGRKIWSNGSRWHLVGAAAVVEQWAAVANANRISRTIREDVRGACGIFAAKISINVQLGIGMSFESS